MSFTGEQTRQRVLAVLNQISATSERIADYTLENINSMVPELTKEQVQNALDDLEGENLVESRRVQFGLFLPLNSKSRELIKDMAKRGLFAYSPIGIVIAALFGAFFLVAGTGYQFPLPTNVSTLVDAYSRGVEVGFIFSGGIALVTGIGGQRLLATYQAARVSYAKAYSILKREAIGIGAVFLPLVTLYAIWSFVTSSPIQPEAIFIVLGASIAVFEAFQQALKRARES
jgi:hypothetical protein